MELLQDIIILNITALITVRLFIDGTQKEMDDYAGVTVKDEMMEIYIMVMDEHQT